MPGVINPERLAQSGTEHAEQMALICWANRAAAVGYAIADSMTLYDGVAFKRYLNVELGHIDPVPSLQWLHAIPNAGARGNKIAAAQLKAEGVKAGVADVFLPVRSFYVPRGFENRIHNRVQLSGLYIEMKRSNGQPSDLTKDQAEFANFVLGQGFAWRLCFGWRQAAKDIQDYLTYGLSL